MAALSLYLNALSSTERRSVLKVSDGTLPFVEKPLEYARKDGKFLPQFLELEEMNNYWDVLKDLIYHPPFCRYRRRTRSSNL